MENALPNLEDYFPLEQPREKQVRALGFIQRKVAEGMRHVILEAPTGLGKSALGMTSCLWAGSTPLEGASGGYYLVTQKLLQDQLERDFGKFVNVYKNTGALLKSATDYPCQKYGNCRVGGQQQKNQRCAQKASNDCPYSHAYNMFASRPIAVTNYPYFFTERTFVKKLPARQVLVMDECHSIERQILGFVELRADNKSLEDWAPTLRPFPVLLELDDFAKWARKLYLPSLTARLEFKRDETNGSTDAHKQRELQDLESHVGKVARALASIEAEPDNWVYWQESTDEGMASIAKPIEAGPYAADILTDNGDLRLYLSAYVGPKNVFCRSIGIDPDQTAYATLNSSFPLANRPIHILPVGSMGRKSADQTLPALLRRIDKIMNVHQDERGLIHVHSYKLGRAVYEHLMAGPHAGRILYPEKSAERVAMLMRHQKATIPTVLISPSMTEGFSFDDDLARWQIIAKMPYASLGDRQVVAKKDRDPEWYVLQTVSTFLQAAGRIVRSDTDHGVTYVLDSDFTTLYDRYHYFFPRWLTDAFQWHA